MRAEGTARITLPGDPLAVRDGLRQLFTMRALRHLTEDERGTAELVLAEALNNIVEHAYARAPGEIDLWLHLTGTGMLCRITDRGAPMPAGTLPPGLPPCIGKGADLPEGGFGWYLIRTLARDLDYRRIADRNELSFRLDVQQSAP
ncbi:ATP-binding protein [Fertoebacter nigrum]|uniref:ATP-binding protein n=1 Tax=Fertoeibacter niger TaxID=2656921 RepID=A0A8X8KMH7_9RHOB|nr:ATP-binding protein [Fertoeibacter niger]NUB46399.1 ATP-binding protein [Fertoeibacter niger]